MAMTQRTSGFALALLVSLGLCGCTAATDSSPSPEPTGGSIGLAVSETCDEGSESQCIPVGNEHVMEPSVFEDAAVENAVASDTTEQSSIDVTFTDEGADVLHNLTTQASDADAESRLLIKVDDEILAAVAVHEPLSGDHVGLGLSPEDDPDAIIELIRGS